MTSVGPRPDFYSTASAQPQEKTKKTREFNPEEAMSVTGGFKDVWQTIKRVETRGKNYLGCRDNSRIADMDSDLSGRRTRSWHEIGEPISSNRSLPILWPKLHTSGNL